MITHLFNSSIVSGPEMLVLPALKKLDEPVSIVFLTESRLPEESLGPIEYAKKLGHQVYSVPVRGRWDSRAFKELRDTLDLIQPRIVHAHDVKASLYLKQAKLIRANFKPKIVSTHHGAAYRKGKIRLYEEFYVRLVLPHFDLVLCVCNQDWESITRRGVSKEKVKIHLNGVDRHYVDANTRRPTQNTIRQQWKARHPTLPDSADSMFLGAVARLSPEKRHDRMMRVLLKLKSIKNKKPILVFFGTGPEEKTLKDLSHQLGLDDSVFWMGYSNTISDEIAGFDILLSLSDGEGIPINLIEAGWAATPIVATKVGGIPDLISSEKFGILVNTQDQDSDIAHKIQNLLNDEPLQVEIGRNLQTRVMEQFSESSWLKRLSELYDF